MDLNFNRVTYDGDLADFGRDDLIELVREFEKAQESNVAEFEKAADTLEGVDETAIEEFEEADNELTKEVAEQTFLSEEEAEALSFQRKREVLADAEEAEDEDFEEDDESDESEKDFEDMGKQGPTHGGDDEGDADFAADMVSEIAGVEVQTE